jgi:restriction endonuclease Mrr
MQSMLQTPIRPQPEIEWHLLRLLQLHRSLTARRAYDELADLFRLSDAERRALIYPEKPELAWENECRFAKRRLLDEGLVVSIERGVWAITDEGDRVAATRGAEYRSTTLTAEQLGL